jgi:hypothetical protein
MWKLNEDETKTSMTAVEMVLDKEEGQEETNDTVRTDK